MGDRGLWGNGTANSGQTFHRVELANGDVVFVNEQAMRTGETSRSRTCELVIHNSVQAEIRPTMAYKAWGWFWVVAGLCAAVIALLQTHIEMRDLLFWVISGSLVAIGGLLSAMGFIGPKRMIIDKFQGVLMVPRGLGYMPELRAGFPLSRLAALQLCYWIEHVQRKHGKYGTREAYSYAMYELNVLVCDGNGMRIVLMTDSDPYRLEYQAKELSKFLGLPLIDSIDRTVVKALVTRPTFTRG